MAYTMHGWHIPMTTKTNINELGPMPQCGGPNVCLTCTKEIEKHRMVIGTDEDHTLKAKKIVTDYVKKKYGISQVFAVYIISFNYVHGSWKAFLSTTIPDGMCYEVKYVRTEKASYLKAYHEEASLIVPDE